MNKSKQTNGIIQETKMRSDKYANSWNQPDTFRIIYTSKATFYGEKKHKD